MGFKNFLFPMALLASLQGVDASVFEETTPKIAAYLSTKLCKFGPAEEKDQYDLDGGGQGITTFCQNQNIDIIQLAFVNELRGEPQALSLSGIQGWEITQCQKQGKTILLSLGGESYKEGGWSTTTEAQRMADALWKKFGPGVETMIQRPFGDAIIDGTAGLNKPFYLTAAPQCQWPHKNLQTVLDSNMGVFDAIFVQFYNNQECGIGAGYRRRSAGPSARRSGLLGNFNLAQWLNLAATSNKGVSVAVTTKSGSTLSSKPKIYVGVPGSELGTSTPKNGYVNPDTLKQAIESVSFEKNEYFGGVSIWSAQFATQNADFLPGVKSVLNGL
ncbi:class III chitinase [Penicillium canariense]|uniref:Class III chitinase n=1 Tax=Penicillium canariense TaxID=189055 RepID=A0A9W9HQX1_9EURO|nr:class III chitinase [Penicillium canariense]KAJ5153214.1 class III chitinase [Penicillium canariense]